MLANKGQTSLSQSVLYSNVPLITHQITLSEKFCVYHVLHIYIECEKMTVILKLCLGLTAIDLAVSHSLQVSEMSQEVIIREHINLW